MGVCLHAIFCSSPKTSGGGGRLCLLLLLLHVLCHLLSSHASSSPASISCLQVTKVAPRRRRQRKEKNILLPEIATHAHISFLPPPSPSKCHLRLSVSLVFLCRRRYRSRIANYQKPVLDCTLFHSPHELLMLHASLLLGTCFCCRVCMTHSFLLVYLHVRTWVGWWENEHWLGER